MNHNMHDTSFIPGMIESCPDRGSPQTSSTPGLPTCAGTLLTARLNRQLQADSGSSMPEHDVLVHLSEAPGGRLARSSSAVPCTGSRAGSPTSCPGWPAAGSSSGKNVPAMAGARSSCSLPRAAPRSDPRPPGTPPPSGSWSSARWTTRKPRCSGRAFEAIAAALRSMTTAAARPSSAGWGSPQTAAPSASAGALPSSVAAAARGYRLDQRPKLSLTTLTVPGMDKSPSGYEVIVRVAQGDGHQPDPATFAVAIGKAASSERRQRAYCRGDRLRSLRCRAGSARCDSCCPGRRRRRAQG